MIHRRFWLACSVWAWPLAVLAGPQREEDFADAVRNALRSAVAAPGAPVLAEVADASAQAAWVQSMAPRFARWLVRHHRAGQAGVPSAPEWTHEAMRLEVLQTIWYEARRAGLEPSLVLGLIEVESGFRKFAISSAGARGLMQVMPFWARSLGEGDAAVLFQLQANLRFGCVILRHYLVLEGGDLTLALGRYNGSRGQSAYPRAVLAAQKRWAG
jgi:soluble lytic murein transglycosylase-like protein